jgi:hypothetical protein
MMRGELALYSYTLESVAFKVVFGGGGGERVPLYHLCALGSVADPDPGSGAFLTPGSGVGKKSDPDPASRSGMNNPDHISERLETIFWG